MIDPLKDKLLSINEAAKVFPTRPHRHTIWRWMWSGCKGILLESILVGGQRYTTKGAIVEFLEVSRGLPHDSFSQKGNAAAAKFQVTRRRDQRRRARAALAKAGI